MELESTPVVALTRVEKSRALGMALVMTKADGKVCSQGSQGWERMAKEQVWSQDAEYQTGWGNKEERRGRRGPQEQAAAGTAMRACGASQVVPYQTGSPYVRPQPNWWEG